MTDLLRAGNMLIDRNSYRVWIGDTPVTLTYIEFELLEILTRNRNRVLSRRELLESVWGQDDAQGSRRLAVHIFRLRKKIMGSYPYAIRTIAKRGYALSDVSSEPRPDLTGRHDFTPSLSSRGLARGG